MCGYDLGMEFTGAVPNLLVSDLQASLPWYIETLGFTVEKELPGPPAGAVLARGQARLLIEQTEGDVAKLPKSTVDPFGLDVLYLVDDATALYRELREKAVEMLHGDADLPDGAPQFGIRTPDGYVIVFSTGL